MRNIRLDRSMVAWYNKIMVTETIKTQYNLECFVNKIYDLDLEDIPTNKNIQPRIKHKPPKGVIAPIHL